ncbi:MAG: monovalent cation/H+ antiporter subunit D family protein [Arenicellales bacterium]|nr:monovalent cation/H+ antiporter subunit D family protein [Arenicellales bacterium]
MSVEGALLLTVLLPLLGAILIALSDSRPNIRETITLATAVVLFLIVLQLLGHDTGSIELVIATPLPQLSLSLYTEPLGLLFATVASGLWIITSIYSIGYMRGNNEQNQTRFYVFFAISISATMGVALSANLFTLFVFYEILTLSTYPLVTHKGTEEAKQGGRVYLGLLLSTSIGFLLVAMVWTWHVAGHLDFTVGGILQDKIDPGFLPLLLALYLFGIGKAALMPFHRWLPAAMVAPTPVSALLHAVAVVKAGVFAVLKVTVYIFGLDFLHNTGANKWLMWMAAITVILASVVALTKDNLKARLAYSTVSQLGYIVLGAMLVNSMAIVGGGMHIATHALGKITLFFCAGAIYVATHKTNISEMDGLGRSMPVTYTAMLIGSLSIIGLPLTGGLWSKWYLALGAVAAEQWAMLAVFMVSSLLNVAYLLIIPIRGFFFSQPRSGETSVIKEAPFASVLALSLTALGCIAMFFFAQPLYEMMVDIFER